MARFPAAEKRLFEGIWICMRCNHKMRSGTNKKPVLCRKCGSKKLRPKKKGKRIAK
ncbi:MAG: 50S ribosomal protein L40e [Candidatus Diapherotrites archaeon]|nr:50S ribosomal protein L40e [Candidatus Diapherotrites archaeon]